ncbi:forkhead-associated protein [Streptomyces sp. AcH 505]|uniref:FHA domain-containing protein n=1 Tax=unclassified Streptomyces TaxID=2593676 RepID=UPI0005921DA3|nr:FHA domain-containing protein [Streptomyces sp. NBC_00370]KIF69873.1 forkhead-associated protein [Streptomyces sp. AcH 505]
MPTCPNGHQSGSEDWCEVCGHRMAGPGPTTGAVPPPPPPPPAAGGYGYPQGGGPGTVQQEYCPQCRTPREPGAPFCEECRWNFLTNTATSYTPLAPAGLNLPPGFQAQQPPRPQEPDPYEYQRSRPSQINRPAEPLASEQPPQGPRPPVPPSFQQQGQQQSHQQGPPAPPSYQQQAGPPAPPQPQAPQRTQADDDWMLPPPSQSQPSYQQQPAQGQQQQGQQQQQQPPQQLQQQPPQQMQQQYQPPSLGWTAVIGPDRDYFMAMMQRSGPEATGLNLPAYSPEQHLPLAGQQITIGRRRHSTGESPDVDLSVPPEDPGVSHQHAVLVHQPDGSWAVVDQNSTNGTTINGGEDPIQPYVPVQLEDGDRVHVGAWTTITIHRG